MKPMSEALKIEQVAAHFAQLLEKEGTSLAEPNLGATWRAFAAFCEEDVDCDEERLFFEADLSSAVPDSFYVHFSRTFYGRIPHGHLWSHEVIADFLFPLDESLEEFGVSIESEDVTGAQERRAFVQQVESHRALWEALSQLQPTQAAIYIGES